MLIKNTSGLVTSTALNTKRSKVEKKIPDPSSLVTTIVLNTKIGEVENKIHDHAKYITAPEFKKLTAEKFKERLGQANVVSKTDFDNKQISFNRKITPSKTKYLEVQEKLNSLKTKDYNFFLGRIYFTKNDGSQNIFVYQPTLDMSELKKDKDTDNVLSWKSNGIYNSKIKPLYTAFLHSIKLSGYRLGINFYKDSLAVEQNNYLYKIVNV